MRITKRQLRIIIKEERARLNEQGIKKGTYGYENADQPTYDMAYTKIMDVVSELGYSGADAAAPTVQAAIYNALTDIAKEFELEIKMPSEEV